MAANSPSPHFRPEDLQRGHFLCIRDADIELCSTSDIRDARVNNFGDARVVKVYCLFGWLADSVAQRIIQ